MDDLHLDDSKPPKLYLPKGWSSIATESILHVIAMARLTILQASAWPSDCEGLGLRAENTRLKMENALLRQEVDIKDANDSEDDPRGYGGIIAKHPDRIWSIDLTEVATSDGFYVPWKPFAISQRWPYCWHVLTVIDHRSRFCIGMVTFEKLPTRPEVTKALDQLFEKHGSKPNSKRN